MGLLNKLSNKTMTAKKSKDVKQENQTVSQNTEKFHMPDTIMPAVELQQRIRSVIESDFPDCQVQCNVHAAFFDASVHEKSKPISLLISKNGINILAIAVVGFNTYRSYPVVGTKLAVEALGITYIRFFCEYENRLEYISNRLAEYLK